jgi:hypothetical protein
MKYEGNFTDGRIEGGARSLLLSRHMPSIELLLTHTVVMKVTKDHYAASVVPQRVTQKQVDYACLVVIFMPI